MDFSEACKCGKVYVNFYFVAVYNSAVMEFWPLLLEQQTKLVLISCLAYLMLTLNPLPLVFPCNNFETAFLSFSFATPRDERT